MEQTKGNRILRHAAFWLVYFSVTFFNELFLTSDFATHQSLDGLLTTLWSEGNLLIIKMALVYYTLNSFIPRWTAKDSKVMMVAEGTGALVIAVVVYRAVIRYVNWELIYHDIPGNLSGASLAARYSYSLLDILQVTGIAAAIKLTRMRLAALKREKELAKSNLKAELQQLKAQVNPHFLFNMLNSIYALAAERSEETQEVVGKLSELMRYMLYQGAKELVPLATETEIVRKYVELQLVRFKGKAIVDIDITIADDQQPIAPLLILPLAENAFKHGTGTSSAPSDIRLRIVQDKEWINVMLTNPVVTRNANTANEGGIGLQNIQRRLALLYREHTFSARQENGLFIVNMRINTTTYAGVEMPDSGR